MSAFTCAACGGFKYNQTSVIRKGPHDLICQDCYENGALGAAGSVAMPRASKKPGLHEVLASIRDAYAGTSIDLSDWLYKVTATTDEEKAAEWIQRYHCDIWKEHYQKITGEPWQ